MENKLEKEKSKVDLIYLSLSDLDRVVSMLEILTGEIKGEVVKEKENPAKPKDKVSVSAMMIELPDLIEDFVRRISYCTNEIEGSLF